MRHTIVVSKDTTHLIEIILVLLLQEQEDLDLALGQSRRTRDLLRWHRKSATELEMELGSPVSQAQALTPAAPSTSLVSAQSDSPPLSQHFSLCTSADECSLRLYSIKLLSPHIVSVYCTPCRRVL